MHEHLPLEAEVMNMLIGGFSIIMFVAIITIIFLWRKNRTKSAAFLWIFVHFASLSIAVYLSLKAISFDINHPMASEEISLLLGEAGALWGASMICLLVGIVKLSKRTEDDII
ncbi:hypothetical protein [Parageobacillus thermoglucosidasius]|uniref:hypothetical protein n=1 Tax=Parageobacillus thermoglucosidasius TaxID=1426 RepID=UPI00031796B8|nr:hypothetical protein [Parageobacillus thermoglucosidasius]KYD14520.1 hypothetical protein B4168_1729 [Anoxybacillus flavithermus]MED4903590.1 hypothetical protein [Parageobacillus thermoglucosidasius]MED4913201.1 hypothetical protein [Parageobacillus thermoglucosidasius]MED4944731.1 hypothetical protein [Parageobacillus thermoglucosidasius]MED4984676.1 hypothetical protein [Parageobacillus thermoglucosidasius]